MNFDLLNKMSKVSYIVSIKYIMCKSLMTQYQIKLK